MSKYFHVYANSCDFGVIVANSAQDACNNAAQMAGYDSEDDMLERLDTETSEIIAEELDPITREDVPLIMQWVNCEECDVDESGDIWVSSPMIGHWLSDDKKCAFMLWRENQ